MLRTLVTALVLAAATVADAAVVPIATNPATSWADGSFTSGLSGAFADGFYNDGTGPTHGFNGYGQNGESILFNAPVEFDSLKLGVCSFCRLAPTSVTVSLYGGGDALLTSQTVASLGARVLLTFDTAGVRKATFTFTGGRDLYGDGRTVAFYSLWDVTYTGGRYGSVYNGRDYDLAGSAASTVSAIPDPAVWLTLITGFGLTGATLRRRRARAS